MASELCMNCFSVKGQYEVCPFCGYVEGTPPEQPHYLTPGTILGNHFIVGTVIGVGGFGITYKCFDTTLGVAVAVKEFYPAGLVNRSPGESRVGLLSGDKKEQYGQQLRRFLMEAQSVAQFGKARDIVNVYDFFEENGTAYIIMEYIDGVLLKDYLEKWGALDPDTAMSIIMPIIEAVKKIHSKGIIHRDISPDNIFISNEDSIKIFDFGTARLNDSKEGMAGEQVIKVGYSALEQYRDKSRQGFFTDVYSVGAILYQMLTGVKPMESTEREFKDDLKSPMQLGVKINANVDRAVMEALAVRPEFRFQGIQQFEEALLSKRIAEYPAEKLRKRKRRRNWMISLSVATAMTIAVSVGLYSTILKPENRIFDSTISEDTTITVWVENEDQKKQIEELAQDGFRKGSSTSADEKVRKMQADNEKVTIQVDVHENMEADLQQCKADPNITMPNMFLTDHVTDPEEYNLVSLEDNVYAALNTDDYLYMSEYKESFSGMREMPTGIDTLLLYTCQFDYNRDNTLEDSAVEDSGQEETKKEKKETVELESLVSADPVSYTTKNGGSNSILNNSLAYFHESAGTYAAVLQNEEWTDVFEKKRAPSQDMVGMLADIRQFNKQACAQTGTEGKKKKKKKETVTAEPEELFRVNRGRKTEPYTGPYGSNIVAGVSYRKTMNDASDNSEEKGDKGINSLNKYETYVVTQDGKMLVTLSERYAITRESSVDQKTACMRLLWVMLGDTGQEKKTAPGETTYPILEKMFKQFVSYNANYDEFIDLVEEYYPCVLIGSETGKAEKFYDTLESMPEDESVPEGGKMSEDEKIQKCYEYYVSGQ